MKLYVYEIQIFQIFNSWLVDCDGFEIAWRQELLDSTKMGIDICM